MTEDELLRELVRLRHGWGLADTDLRRRVGPCLVRLCFIVPGDDDRAIRHKVLAWVDRVSAGLAPQDRAVVGIVLGGSAGAQLPQLAERLGLVQDRLHCAGRGARRAMDRAFIRLAEEGLSRQHFEDASVDDDPEKGWYLRSLTALLRLDRNEPEVIETRTIVAQRDGLQEIAIRYSLPSYGGQNSHVGDLDAEVSYGAMIDSKERLGATHFRFSLKLPRLLAHGEDHTYGIIFRPKGGPIRPHYALVPLVPVESFEIRIRYNPERRPEAVWRLDHLAPQMLNERGAPGPPLHLDEVNEVSQNFEQIERGFGYGIAWTMPDQVMED